MTVNLDIIKTKLCKAIDSEGKVSDPWSLLAGFDIFSCSLLLVFSYIFPGHVNCLVTFRPFQVLENSTVLEIITQLHSLDITTEELEVKCSLIYSNSLIHYHPLYSRTLVFKINFCTRSGTLNLSGHCFQQNMLTSMILIHTRKGRL